MLDIAIEHASTIVVARSSKFDSLFTTEERAELDEFVTYLVEDCGFKRTSASSYRANLSRACLKLSKNEALNSDERSALRKFAAFKA